MWEVEKKFKIRLGGSTFINVETLIAFKNVPLCTVRRRDSDGLLGVDCDIYDPEGRKVATMRHGNIVSGDHNNYEITLDPHHYTIIDKASGRAICELKRKDAAVAAELDLSVDMFDPSGFRLRATPDCITLPGNNQLFNCTFESGKIGIAIG